MKKTLIILAFILVTLSGNSQTWLKKGAIIGNTPNQATVDSIVLVDGRFKFYIGGIQVSDNDDIRISEATEASTVFIEKADSNVVDGGYATVKYVQSLMGSGEGYSIYTSEFTVDDSGYPSDGDSTITSADWAGKAMMVFRDGALQRLRTIADGREGVRVNNTTGELTIHPPFVSGENIIINGYDPAHKYSATISGVEESSLLTGLRALYQFNETSGAVANDVTNVYNGTTNATVGVTGYFGYGEQFDGINDYVNLGNTVLDIGTNDFTLYAWVYPTAYPATYHVSGVLGSWGDYPYTYFGVDATHNAVGVINFAGSNIEILSNNAIPLNAWTFIAITADRDGNLSMWVGNNSTPVVLQTDVASIAAHSAVSVVNNNTHAIGQIGTTYEGYNFTGTLDVVGVALRVLTESELNTLRTSSYPWN